MSAAPSGAQPPKTPWGHANIARQQQLFAATPRSKAWRGVARPGQAAQDG
ncbi:MAG: hypothetical protein HY268_24440 [Deltaproteobacteria bacterium]|nr:hypothetical protein [Deltaproteobacteria bacterium]